MNSAVICGLHTDEKVCRRVTVQFLISWNCVNWSLFVYQCNLILMFYTGNLKTSNQFKFHVKHKDVKLSNNYLPTPFIIIKFNYWIIRVHLGCLNPMLFIFHRTYLSSLKQWATNSSSGGQPLWCSWWCITASYFNYTTLQCGPVQSCPTLNAQLYFPLFQWLQHSFISYSFAFFGPDLLL